MLGREAVHISLPGDEVPLYVPRSLLIVVDRDGAYAGNQILIFQHFEEYLAGDIIRIVSRQHKRK